MPGEELQELLAKRDVEVRGRLVEQLHVRAAGDRPPEPDPLLLPARQLRGTPIGKPADAQAIEDRMRLASRVGPGPAVPLERVRDRLEGREMRPQRRGLEHDTDVAPLRRLEPTLVGHESAAQRDRPGLHRQEARDRREQRGLARAGRPEQRQHLPGSHGQIQPVEDEHRAVADADRSALDGRDGVSGHARRWVHSASGIAARPTSPVSSTASAAVTVGSPSCWTFRTTTARVAVCEP